MSALTDYHITLTTTISILIYYWKAHPAAVPFVFVVYFQPLDKKRIKTRGVRTRDVVSWDVRRGFLKLPRSNSPD